MKKSLLAIGAALAVLSVAPLAAQSFPTKQVVIVVPFAAGGPTDTVARLIGEQMGKSLGQTVIVENVAGAGGTTGAARVAKAPPDGYTLLLHHIGQATSATLYRRLSYNARTDFAPIGLVTDVPMTLVAKKDFPASTLAEAIAHVKANKDKVTMANAGIGAASHLCGMLFMSAIDTKLTTVPYRGTGPAMTDLLGGQVDLMCDQTTNTTSQIQGGQVKAFAVTSPTRVPALPNLPTAVEAGLKGFDVEIWHGLYGPKGTPAPVVAKLAEALRVALADRSVIERFAALGTTPVSAADATPAALERKLGSEIERWAPVIRAAGQFAD